MKRLLDLVVSSVGLVVTAPFWLLIIVLIRLDSPGRTIFTQDRLGKDGRPFTIYKFRTMVVGAPNGAVMAGETDPRVTRIGAFLRKTSLDELPQLLNILQGDMSLVGPRPDRTFRLPDYTDFEKRRLAVRPGVTGLAQVNGRNAIPWDLRYKYDVEYVTTYSIWLDLKILFKTFSMVVRRQNIDFLPETNPDV